MEKNIPLWAKKCFSHQNEPHTAKVSFSGVLKYTCGNKQTDIYLRSGKCFSHQNEHIELN